MLGTFSRSVKPLLTYRPLQRLRAVDGRTDGRRAPILPPTVASSTALRKKHLEEREREREREADVRRDRDNIIVGRTERKREERNMQIGVK